MENIKNFDFKFSSEGFKDYNKAIGKNINILAQSAFKNLRTYLFLFIIPILAMMALILFQTNDGANDLRIAQIIGFSQIPCFFVLFLVNVTISEWKQSVFLKRIHSAGISKNNFLLSVVIFNFLMGILAFLVGFAFLAIIGTFYIKNQYGENLFKQIEVITVGGWFGIALGTIFTILISIFLGIIISGISRSIALSQSIALIVIMFSLVFADNFLNPGVIATNEKLTYFSYIVPYKHSIWTSYLLMSIGSDGNVITSFIFDGTVNRLTKSFDFNPIIPIFTSIAYIAVLATISSLTFRWNNK